MATDATSRSQDRDTGRTQSGIVSWIAAIALGAAAVWYALLAEYVTVDAPPASQRGESAEASLERFYAWASTTLPQERASLVLLLVGLVGIAFTALGLVRGRWPLWSTDRLGVLGVVGGVALWGAANVMQAGGHRAVEMLASHNNPIQNANDIGFAVDVMNIYAEVTASILMAAGLIAFVVADVRSRGADGPSWAAFTSLVAGALATMGVMKLADMDDLWLEVGIGAVLLPVWLVWTARRSPANTMSWPTADADASGRRRVVEQPTEPVGGSRVSQAQPHGYVGLLIPGLSRGLSRLR